MVLQLRTYGKDDNVTYNLVDGEGGQFVEAGPYLICDNGFMKWRCLMPPMRYPTKRSEARWSAQVESVRKDVERAFGIIKGRFRCLKVGLLFHFQEDIDNLFFTCILLHNMILSYDGRDKLWEADMLRRGTDGDIDGDALDQLSDIYHRAVTRVGSQAIVNDPEEELIQDFIFLDRS